MRLNTPYKLLLLAGIILAVYLHTAFGIANNIDDWNMLMDLDGGTLGGLDLRSLFVPNASLYYRPLTMLTFLGDKVLWNLTPSIMLVENILIHLGNAVLVFLLARKIFIKLQLDSQTTPLLCALLFGLHPLATESVNWISGRTDPLATLFMLASSLILCLAIEQQKTRYYLLASLLGLCGILSKEMAFFFVLANFLLIFFWPRSSSVKGERRVIAQAFIFIAPFIVAGVVLLLSRYLRFGGQAIGVKFLVGKITAAPLETMVKAITIFGFYIKKLLLPLPLNFTIIEVSKHYFWAGLLGLLLFFGVLKVGNLAARILALALFLICPAVILGLTHIAWTPMAERYVYMTLPFFVIGVVGVVSSSAWGLGHQRYVGLALAAVVAACIPVTFARNMLWQDKARFYQETTAMNPNFSLIRNEMAWVYFQQGQPKEAEEQLRKGISLIRPEDGDRPELLYANLASFKIQQGNLPEAENILSEVMCRFDKPSDKVLETKAQLLEKRLSALDVNQERDREAINHLRNDLVAINHQLYDQTSDPFYLYIAGREAMAVSNKKLAVAYLLDCVKKAPPQSTYKNAAQSMAAQLEGL
jgi:tetratricopeptide (TPR) repeat protein